MIDSSTQRNLVTNKQTREIFFTTDPSKISRLLYLHNFFKTFQWSFRYVHILNISFCGKEGDLPVGVSDRFNSSFCLLSNIVVESLCYLNWHCLPIWVLYDSVRLSLHILYESPSMVTTFHYQNKRERLHNKLSEHSEEVEVNWLFNVTINGILVIYVTAHRCAGGLKRMGLRSASQRHRHFIRFFNVVNLNTGVGNSIAVNVIRTQSVLSGLIKQNRERTGGCSRCIVQKNNDKFGKKIGVNK